MKLHLVGGFLGSGKTTAIATAAKLLLQGGVRTSAILNDQGTFLVDRQFIEGLGISNGEVTGGCFCCNYNQLAAEIDRLSGQASVIFAESVGSCTDLVATVIKPLLELKKDTVQRITFSTFADARLVCAWLKGKPLPFDDNTNYIWEKQLEESEVLVINKIDLLSEAESEFIRGEVKEYPSKTFVFQNSLDETAVRKWLGLLDDLPPREHIAINIDYDRYATGEANLAWLDESIEVITKNGSAMAIVRGFIQTLTSALRREGIVVGHLKFLIHSDSGSHKISYSAIPESDPPPGFAVSECNRILVVVNARVQMPPGSLRAAVTSSLDVVRSGREVEIIEKNISVFQPGFPRPTHRLA